MIFNRHNKQPLQAAASLFLYLRPGAHTLFFFRKQLIKCPEGCSRTVRYGHISFLPDHARTFQKLIPPCGCWPAQAWVGRVHGAEARSPVAGRHTAQLGYASLTMHLLLCVCSMPRYFSASDHKCALNCSQWCRFSRKNATCTQR